MAFCTENMLKSIDDVVFKIGWKKKVGWRGNATPCPILIEVMQEVPYDTSC
jgi:hypothetical protein